MNRDIKLLFEAYNSIKEAEDTNIDTFHKELAKQWASLFLDKLHEYPITSRSAHLERLLDGSLEVFKKYILDDIKSKKLSYLKADAFSKSEDAQSIVKKFTVVSGGVDNTSDVGFDLSEVDHEQAQSLQDVVDRTIEDMENDEDFADTFPQEYREFKNNMFIMSTDSGDFVAVLPGHLDEKQVFAKLASAFSEDKKGLSDQEYHQARKFGLESAGEVVGKGPIKIQLTKDQTLLCTRDGREQEVKFVKGVIFNCDEWVGDYYHCESKKYGGVAVFPPDIKLLSAPEGTITHLTPE